MDFIQIIWGTTIPITRIDFSNLNTSNVINMKGMFIGLGDISSLDLSNFDTSKVTNMRNMFVGCTSLTSLNLSNFDTSKVTDIYGMFAGCIHLTSLDVSNFDVSKVTSMQRLFDSCNNLNHIKCKQAFKAWCLINRDIIALPDAMKNGTEGAVGSGANWEIIDYVPEGVYIRH